MHKQQNGCHQLICLVNKLYVVYVVQNASVLYYHSDIWCSKYISKHQKVRLMNVFP